MASACFIYSSDRTKKNNVRNNIKNFRNNVIVLAELCQTKFDIVPNFIRARGQKLSGTSASLLIDSRARTRASRTFDRAKKNNLRNNIKNPRNNVIALEVAVRATEVLDLKALKVNECGTARQSVMIGRMYCCIHKPILPCF